MFQIISKLQRLNKSPRKKARASFHMSALNKRRVIYSKLATLNNPKWTLRGIANKKLLILKKLSKQGVKFAIMQKLKPLKVERPKVIDPFRKSAESERLRKKVICSKRRARRAMMFVLRRRGKKPHGRSGARFTQDSKVRC